MGHYDSCYEDHYAEQRAQRLKVGRKTIASRLSKLANAMRTLGVKGVDVVEEAAEHLK